MMVAHKRVLMVATSPTTHGGITAVIKGYQKCRFWKKWHCRWIASHCDGSVVVKLWFFFRGFAEYAFLLPFYDIVHIHFSEFPSALRKSFFVMLAKLLGKKIVIHLHTYSPLASIEGKHKKVYRYLFESADRAIVLSKIWKTSVEQAFGSKSITDKTCVVYNPCVPCKEEKGDTVDLCLLNTIRTFMEGRKIILYAGTVEERKGYGDLLKAFCKLKDTACGWSLVIAGLGDVDQGKAMATRLGISNLVLWTGWIDGVCKQYVFSHADVFCLPSYAEGFPMGVLDAWSYVLPVVTTPVGGIPDVAEDGKNMLLAQPGDVDGLSRCLSRLMFDEALRENISLQSQKLAQGVFALDACDRKINEIYQKLFVK